jgi:O-methyltransferase
MTQAPWIPYDVRRSLGGRPVPDFIQQAATLVADGDAAQAEQVLRRQLESGTAPVDVEHTVAGLAFLLAVLMLLGRVAKAADVFRAPWSPIRDLCDETYDRQYAAGLHATGTPPLPLARRLRFHELVRQFRATRGVAGEVAECGCFRGLSSFLLCGELAAEDSRFDGSGYRIFDSFQGLSEPLLEDEIPDTAPDALAQRATCSAGAFAVPLAVVQRNLSAFPRISWHPGWIPSGFKGLPERRYRFVHVDVDLYEPTDESLRYFHPRLSPGGILVCDDYNWPGARLALEEFAEREGVTFSVTPFLR